MELSDPDIRRFFEYCAGRSRHRSKTIIRFIQKEIEKKHGVLTPLPKLNEAFEYLKSLGIVELVGSGSNTEIHWKRSIIDVGREALAGQLPDLGVAGHDSNSSVSLRVDFPRDAGSIIRLELPADLSASEAARLADVVRALGRGTVN